jgi:hypothetical protein
MSGLITDALIIKSTGQYDKEVVHRLRLEGLGSKLLPIDPFHLMHFQTVHFHAGLQRISNLDESFNLVDLSLSRNEVRYT